MNNEEPSYYAIIPASVRYDGSLQQGAKLLYGEISALTDESGLCWTSNSYFANLYHVSTTTIQNWLRVLEECKYIVRHVKYKDGTKEVEGRYIEIITETMRMHLFEEGW